MPGCPRVIWRAGWLGIGGERAAVVVRHNGGGGGRFRRGSTWVVVGSDAGGCSGCYGSGRGTRKQRTCACEAAVVAVAVGLGRKMTGWGPRVSERGRLAGWADQQAEAQRGSGEGSPKGGEERASWEWVAAKREGMGERAIRLKARTGTTQEEKKSFSNFFYILDLAERWKMVQGDFDRIWTWGFFLKSSRFSRNFRKMNI
jgi:hypothetical protein